MDTNVAVDICIEGSPTVDNQNGMASLERKARSQARYLASSSAMRTSTSRRSSWRRLKPSYSCCTTQEEGKKKGKPKGADQRKDVREEGQGKDEKKGNIDSE